MQKKIFKKIRLPGVTFLSFVYKLQIHKQKTEKMKKLLMILALGAFVACNDSASTTEATSDSLAEKVDSTTDQQIDSLKDQKDSLVNKLDSNRDATIDTLKK